VTIHYTPTYGLPYADVDTPLVDLAAVSQELATKHEAALLAGGLAPPSSADLATLIGQMRRGWVDLTTTTNTYSASAAVTWTLLPNQVVTLAVPAGQTVEAMFHSPAVNVSAGGEVWVKFGIYAGTPPVAAAMAAGIGGAARRFGSAAIIPAEMMLHTSYRNTGSTTQTVTLQVAAIATAGSAVFSGQNLSPVGIKARLL
jgi:hypothetical protein